MRVGVLVRPLLHRLEELGQLLPEGKGLGLAVCAVADVDFRAVDRKRGSAGVDGDDVVLDGNRGRAVGELHRLAVPLHVDIPLRVGDLKAAGVREDALPFHLAALLNLGFPE